MDQDEYIRLCKKHSAIDLIRPFWNYHRQWNDITVLICQRNTKTLIQLCLESLLTYYPNIPILVVDGNSDDDSILYLRYKSLVYPKIGHLFIIVQNLRIVIYLSVLILMNIRWIKDGLMP